MDEEHPGNGCDAERHEAAQESLLRPGVVGGRAEQR